MRRVELEPELSLSELVNSRGGSRANAESLKLAHELSVYAGPRAGIIDVYLEVLARAPARDLRLLQARDCCFVFAPTIPDALESPWAAERRGRELTAKERLEVWAEYGPDSETAGIYDPGLDIVVLPTSYAAHRDRDRVVLHELGHAMTMLRARSSRALLHDLPTRIERLIQHRDYGPDGDPDTLRKRCLEVMAEAYRYHVDGREDELPGAVSSELVFILSTVDEGDRHIRLVIDDETDLTATRVSTSQLTFGDDPEIGHLLAQRPADGAELEVRELESDDLAVRRARHRAA